MVKNTNYGSASSGKPENKEGKVLLHFGIELEIKRRYNQQVWKHLKGCI